MNLSTEGLVSEKEASSDAAWALITEGVTAARLEAHRLRHLINRGIQLAETSEEREHLYAIAGDLIIALPKRLTELDRCLDRTALALSKMGDTFLSSRLSIDDKTVVEEAVEYGGSWEGGRKKSTQRVVARWQEREAARLSKTEQKLLDMVERSPRGYTAFNAGLMRRGMGRYTKLYKTNQRLRAAALSLQDKGLVEIESGPVEYGDGGEQYRVITVRLARR